MGYDQYGRFSTGDAGVAAQGAAPAAGLQPGQTITIKVPLTAGAGTALDVQVTCPQKARLIDTRVNTTSTVTSAVVQVFTAAAGGGTAASSSIAAAAAGIARDALTTATQVFAAGAIIYVRQSGGATLSGGEVYLTLLPEQ
jgi:hypothetical protein